MKRWQWDEYQQCGKDYSQPEEADRYDASHADFRDAQAEARDILDMLQLEAGSFVVEIGTGTGTFALEAAQRGQRVLALDVSQAMLNHAAAKLANADFAGQVELRLQGFLDFEVKPGTVDVVVSSLAFHHLPDFWKGQALQKIYGALKPGGTFFLQDVVYPDEAAQAAVQAFIDRQMQRGGEFLRDDAIQHFREEYSTYHWIMQELITRAGMEIRQVNWVEGIIARYVCTKKV